MPQHCLLKLVLYWWISTLSSFSAGSSFVASIHNYAYIFTFSVWFTHTHTPMCVICDFTRSINNLLPVVGLGLRDARVCRHSVCRPSSECVLMLSSFSLLTPPPQHPHKVVFTSGIPDAASRDRGQPEAVPGGLLKKVL